MVQRRSSGLVAGNMAGALELDLAQQEQLELREEELREEHFKFIDEHPELRQVLNDFLSSVLLHRPDDVFAFAREYFMAFKQTQVTESVAAAMAAMVSVPPPGDTAEGAAKDGA